MKLVKSNPSDLPHGLPLYVNLKNTVLNLPTTKRRVKRTNVKDFRELSIGVRKRKLLIKQSESNSHLSSFKSGRATDKRIAKSEIVKGETIKG